MAEKDFDLDFREGDNAYYDEKGKELSGIKGYGKAQAKIAKRKLYRENPDMSFAENEGEARKALNRYKELEKGGRSENYSAPAPKKTIDMNKIYALKGAEAKDKFDVED